MYTVLVLLGFLASALAVPTQGNAGANYAVKPPLDILPASFPFVAIKNNECYDKCVAVYGPSGDDYTYCIIGCNLGEQKFVDKKVVVEKIEKPIVDDKREARITRAQCELECTKEGRFGFATCVYSNCRGLRDRSLEDVTIPPKVTLDKKVAVVAPFYPEFVDKIPLEFYVKECLDKCLAVYGSLSSDYKYCTIGCNLGGQKFEDKKVAVVEKIVEPIVDDKREARITRAQCELNCFIEGPFYYAACISDRCKGLHRSLEDVAITPKVPLDKNAAVIAPFYPEFVDKKPVEFYVKECYERCESLYKKTETDYNYCLIGCTVGGQKFEDKVAVVDVKPFTPVRQ